MVFQAWHGSAFKQNWILFQERLLYWIAHAAIILIAFSLRLLTNLPLEAFQLQWVLAVHEVRFLILQVL